MRSLKEGAGFDILLFEFGPPFIEHYTILREGWHFRSEKKVSPFSRENLTAPTHIKSINYRDYIMNTTFLSP